MVIGSREYSTVNSPADTGFLDHLADFESIKDPVTALELVRSGCFASIFGSNIIISKFTSPNDVFILGEPSYVGKMPIRREIECGDINLVRAEPIEYDKLEEIEYTRSILSMNSWYDIIYGSEQSIIDALEKDTSRLGSMRMSRESIPISSYGSRSIDYVPGITSYHLTIDGQEISV